MRLAAVLAALALLKGSGLAFEHRCSNARPDPAVAADDLVTPIRIGRADAPLTLTMWAQPDYSHLAARQGIAEAFHDIFAEWVRARPDVAIEVSVMPALELHKAKLLLAAGAGRLPDVASVDSFWVPLFREGGHVQPLDPEWTAEERADFMPFAIDTLSDEQGHVYGLWHGTDCRVLYYRKDLVPRPPETWDELLRTASTIAKERGINGYLYNAGRWEATVFDHLPMFWAQGGELVDAEGRPVFGDPPHRERMVRVLSFLRDTVRTGASPRSVLASNDYKQLSSAAIAGDVAMFLGGNWQLVELSSGLQPEELAKWDIAPIPQREPGRRSTGTGGWIWVVFAKEQARRRAAIDLLRFIESPAHVARIEQHTGHLPVRKSLYRDHALYRDDPWLARFGAMLADARARPAVPIYPALSEQLQLAIGSAIAGTETPEQAVDRAFAATRAIDARLRAPRSVRRSDPWPYVPVVLAIAGAGALALSLRRSRVLAWLGPALLLVGVFLAYPLLDLLRLALSDARTGQPASRYGLVSFAELMADREFFGMLGVTLMFVGACVALQLGLGLLLSVALDSARRARRPGTLAVRVAVVSAWVVPGVLVGVLWKVVLVENRSGIANYALSLLGQPPLPWLSSPVLAMVSVVLANTWRGCAFSMILLYAALQRVPRELHEAADLEGLGPLARFRIVSWPQIRPAAALNLALITIYTLNTFDLILPLTGGGPARATEVVSLFMYRSAFMSLEAGRAAAVAVVMLAVNLVLALMAFRVMRDRGSAS
jgi:multiple sugar transport system substrate-binding protein